MISFCLRGKRGQQAKRSRVSKDEKQKEGESVEGSVLCLVPVPKDLIYADLPFTPRVTTLFARTLKARNPLCGLSMFEVGLVVEKYPRMDTPPLEI